MASTRDDGSKRFHTFGLDRLDVLLMLAFVVVAGSWVNEMTAQPAARYLLTAAIVEEHTVELDAYEPVLGVDRIELDGHVYSDKAPLQPLLGVPVAAVAQLLGVPEASSYLDSSSAPRWAEANVGVWVQTFVFAVLPGACLLPLLRRHARRYVDDRYAIASSVAMVSSTMILLFSVFLYAHVLVAFLAFLAWHIASSKWSTPGRRLTTASVIIAIACAVEYPVFGAAAILCLWVWHRHGIPRAVLFGVPTAMAGVSVLAWNRAVYGVADSSYSHKGGSTFGAIGFPKLENTLEILLGRKGFIFTPIVLLAVAGLAVCLYRRRADIAVPAAVLTFAFLLQAGWANPWGGEAANPRYMLLALPFLVYPLATIRAKVSNMFFRLLVGVGTLSMGLAAVTLELIPDGGHRLIETNLRYLINGQRGTTVFALAFGPVGWVIYASLSVAVVTAAVRAARTSNLTSTCRGELPHSGAGSTSAQVLDLVP